MSSAAITSGMPIANGTASSSSALFSRTRQKIGSVNVEAYALGPTQVAVMPFQIVIE